MSQLKSIAETGRSFRQNGGNATNIEASTKTLPVLVEQWDKMADLMLPHLAEEEEQLLTFIKDKFTFAEFNRLVNRIVQAEGLHGARVFLPSIFESVDMWGTESNRAALLKEIPFPIYFMATRFWVHSYRKYHRGVLNSLRSGAPIQVIIEK